MKTSVKEFARRTLRTWAVIQAVYAVAIALVVIVYVPWKTPVANGLALAYAALQGAGAVGAWRVRRWGWRVSLAAGLVGLVACVAVCSALLASWAYLRAVFGDFGRGASLAALLFASVALQVLGLVPALQLRALLRREVRAAMGAGRGLVGALWGHVALPFVVAALVFARYRLAEPEPVPRAAQDQALAQLRAALEGGAGARLPDGPALRGLRLGEGTLYASLWHEGQLAARVTARGDDLAEAVREAATSLGRSAALDEAARRGGRLKVDLVVDAGPVASEWGPVLALSINPGVDGLRRCRSSRSIGGQGGEECRVLLPDDLVRDQRFGVAPLVPGIREIRLGMDAGPVLEQLELEGGRLERLRTASWVERAPGGRALAVSRGNTPAAGTGPEAWRRAAVAGGDFILRQIRRDGRFHYIFDPLAGRPRRGGGYSLPRHAGTVYALALLHGLTGEARFRRGADRAIAWMGERIPERCGRARGACVAEGATAQLGSSALAAVGLLEYQRRTGDDRYAPMARRLLDFLLDMQRADGDFDHVYDLRQGRSHPDDRRMFASEEAALALVMARAVLGDPSYLRAAERALDYLTGPKYDYFLGRFMYGADHWTCIAAEEAHPLGLRSERYLDFCRGYASFMRRIQYQPGEWHNADFTGHYGFGAVMVPQAPAAAGFSEAIVSTYALSRRHGEPDEALREQAALALDALSRDQIRDDNAWLMPRPDLAAGGIRRSLVEQEIRIDFTQHAACALIRGAVL